MGHPDPHPQSGQVIIMMINGAQVIDFQVEDWADRVQPNRPDDDMVWGRVLGTPVPLSRTFHNDDLQVRSHNK